MEYPNGNVWDQSCHDPLGVSDWLDQINSETWEFRLADGGKVVFTKITVNGTDSNRPTAIIDPYGQVTTITYYDPDYPFFIQRVTEPGGRFLLFTYDSGQGGARLTQVDAYDGQGNPGNLIDSVSYTYSSERPQYSPSPSPTPPRVRCLADVGYSDNTHAYYSYTEDNVPQDWEHGSRKLFPLVKTLQDPRYNGAMHRLAYVYQNGGPHGAILKEQYWNGQAEYQDVSSISPTPPPPNVPQPNFETHFTETRGDQQHRDFWYTPLHITRCVGDQCSNPPCPEWNPGPGGPAPQQFLTEYTDFKGNHTWLDYDRGVNNDKWYVNWVKDARGNITQYDRGPPPPEGIGEIKHIIPPGGSYPDGFYIEYTYEDHGHYITSVRDENGHLTTFHRDGYHRVTEIDYPADGNTPASYEQFQEYNSFGQFQVHVLKNGASERFVYDNRGLLTEKYNPKFGGAPGGETSEGGPGTPSRLVQAVGTRRSAARPVLHGAPRVRTRDETDPRRGCAPC